MHHLPTPLRSPPCSNPRRSQACANLRLVAKTEKGAEACAAGGEDSACRALVAAISDDDRAVQAAALRTLEQLCMWQCGADTVVRMNSVLPGLVSSVEGEPDLRALQLNLVRACLARRGNDLALAQCLDHRGADGVDVCTRTLKQHCAKLTAPVAPLVVVAASVLTLLCFRADAKEKAVEAGAVPVLVRCMAASDMAVKIAATRAAACIMTCVPGKLAFFDSGGANVLQSMLLVKHDPLLIVALK